MNYVKLNYYLSNSRFGRFVGASGGNDQLLKGCILACFPFKPSDINRSDISVRLDAVRDFRNRVYHNEPICFVHHVLDYKPAQEIESLIEQLCDWMDPDLKGVIRLFPVEYS